MKESGETTRSLSLAKSLAPYPNPLASRGTLIRRSCQLSPVQSPTAQWPSMRSTSRLKGFLCFSFVTPMEFIIRGIERVTGQKFGIL